jgi:hypothetical protein
LKSTKSKISPFFEGTKMTAEEREWIAHEEGFDEGYEAGVVDFEEVERRKAELRAKGMSVIGD